MQLTPIAIQFFGMVGYLLLANSYFSKEKYKLLIVQIIANCFLAIHYYFLSGLAGAICDLVCIITDATILFVDKKKTKNKTALAICLVIFLLIVVYFTYKSLGVQYTFEGTFPIFATALIIISLVSDDQNKIRIMGLIVAICWLIYGVICGSYAAIVFECLIIMTTITSYLQDKKQKKSS